MSGLVVIERYMRLPTSLLYGVRSAHLAISGGTGSVLSGRHNWSPATIGVSTGCALVWLYCSMRWLILAICDKDNRWCMRLQVMVKPRMNFAGPRSEMSHGLSVLP